MCGGFVSHEGLDVEIYGNLPGGKERDRDTGAHFFRMNNMALTLHTATVTVIYLLSYREQSHLEYSLSKDEDRFDDCVVGRGESDLHVWLKY